MLNLSEEWKKAYESFLEEEEKRALADLENLPAELMKAHNESVAMLEAVAQYFELYDIAMLTEDETGNARPNVYYIGGGAGTEGDKKDSEVQRSTSDLLKQMLTLLPSAELRSEKGKDPKDYTPAATYTIKTVGEMKFPQNIIFFVQQIIAWIKNVVLFFIEKIKNIIRTLLGDKRTEIDYDKLKLDLKKAEKVETVSTQFMVGNSKDVLQARKIKSEELLREGLTDSILKDTTPNPGKERVVITLDISKDIEDLKMLAEHFFNLYDGAYGSFNEKLFDTSDLEVVLRLFNTTLRQIDSGEIAKELTIGGASTEVAAVSAVRVRENLVNTNTNIERLKRAYVETNAKIKDIVKIINNKQLLALTDLGVEYQMLTASTIKALLPLVKAIPERLKDAKQIERNLNKAKDQYEKFTKELNKLQRGVASVSNITYSSVYSRRLQELFLASRYMSDIITLRLSGLSLYIKELSDMRDVIKMITEKNKI